MNAALLIVTSACLTGADPVPLLAQPVPPGAVYADKAPDKVPDKGPDKQPEKIPVTPAPGPVIAPVPAPGSCGSGCASGCASGCGSGCGQWCESPGLFSRFRGHRSHGCDTCNTCAPAPCSPCDSCARPSFWDRFRCHSHCEPACGSSCNTCESPGLFSRLRLGSRHGCGCEPACGGCSSGYSGGCTSTPGTIIAPVPVVKPGEPVKVMPKEGEPKKLPDGKEATLPVVPELTPASKTIEVGTKSPF